MKLSSKFFVIIFLFINSLLILSAKKNDSYFGKLDEIKPNKELSLSSDENCYSKSVFYHIWVPAFSDSNGDGVGDIRGIIDKLDYLNDGDETTTKDLGITGIYLSPIFDCSSKHRGKRMHGYDTIDYYKINPYFGTQKDVEELLQEAHKRGIRIIFDFVLNHTSALHPWFKNAAHNGDKRDWYVWRKYISKKWGRPWGGGSRKNVWFPNLWSPFKKYYYYSAFSRNMPDLNYNNKQVRQAMGNILIYWLNKGFDGIRIDGARYIFEDGPQKAADRPKTFTFFKHLRVDILDKYSQKKYTKFMVGEVWASDDIIKNYYGNGTDEFNMCFDFPLIPKLQKAVKFGGRSSQIIDTLNNYINNELNNFPKGFRSATFLSNHDPAALRPMTVFKKNEKKTLLSILINLSIPGTPFLYYGNEIGMESISIKGTPSDAKFRTPMEWDKVKKQLSNSNSLLNKVEELIHIRTKYSAFFTQNYKRLKTSNDKIFAFLREDNNEKIIVAINLSKEKQNCTIDLNNLGTIKGIKNIITQQFDKQPQTEYEMSFENGFDYRVLLVK